MELLMIFFTLLVIGLLCLAFKSTRLAGIVGLTLLFLVFPFAFIVLLVLGCVFLYFNRKLNRRISMCIPNQNYLIDALNVVLDWNLPDELIPLAVNDQAKLMAGFDAEDDWLSPESFVSFPQ